MIVPFLIFPVRSICGAPAAPLQLRQQFQQQVKLNMRTPDHQQPPRSFYTHQFPNITTKQPFKQSKEVKSYVSFKEITEATELPQRTGLLDLAKHLLRQRNEPVEVLTNRLALFYRRRTHDKQNQTDQPTSQAQLTAINRKQQLNLRGKVHSTRARKPSTPGLLGEGGDDIVLKICRLELHDGGEDPSSRPKQPRTCSRMCPNTSRTIRRKVLSIGQSSRNVSRNQHHPVRESNHCQGRLSAWEIANFDDDF